MTKRLLDLFCGAGGAAWGYHLAGFEVVGVDNRPQPRYPFAFVQGDALNPPVRLSEFDAIHASPPCQRFSPMARATGCRENHPDLIPQTRALLESSGLPWVIENVPEAPLHSELVLCAASFGLPAVRHRRFESNVFLWGVKCSHVYGGTFTGQYVAFRRGKSPHTGKRPPRTNTRPAWRDAIGVPWMNGTETAQAIPPAYTEYIGRQLMEVS